MVQASRTRFLMMVHFLPKVTPPFSICWLRPCHGWVNHRLVPYWLMLATHSTLLIEQQLSITFNIFCPPLANLLINCYRSPSLLFVGGSVLISEEGTTQGNPLSIPLYALATIDSAAVGYLMGSENGLIHWYWVHFMDIMPMKRGHGL